MKKHLFLISIVSLSVIAFFFLLNFTVLKPNENQNGFSRKKLAILKERRSVSFKDQLRGIAGYVGGKLIISTSVPERILICNPAITSIEPRVLNFTSSFAMKGSFEAMVFHDSLYFAFKNIPLISQVDLRNGTLKSYNVNYSFSKQAFMAPNKMVIRGFSPKIFGQGVRSVNYKDSVYKEGIDVLENFKDGGFATDGMLRFDSISQRVVYTYFYSNRITLLDTGLNVKARFNTIDTFSNFYAMGKAMKSKNGTSYSFQAPPKLMNYGSYVYNGKLLILSNLKADNDSDLQFGMHSILDVYDITTQKYKGTIYLENQSRKHLVNLTIHDDEILAVYNNDIAIYKADIKSLLQ